MGWFSEDQPIQSGTPVKIIDHYTHGGKLGLYVTQDNDGDVIAVEGKWFPSWINLSCIVDLTKVAELDLNEARFYAEHMGSVWVADLEGYWHINDPALPIKGTTPQLIAKRLGAFALKSSSNIPIKEGFRYAPTKDKALQLYKRMVRDDIDTKY